MENQPKQKKLNWWTRKSTAGKISFIIAAIITFFAIMIFITMMDLRRFGNDDLANQFYGPDISSGWAIVGRAMVNSVGSWLATLFVLVLMFVIIFVTNFITHLFDNGSRKARTISSLIRSLVKYISIIVAIAVVLAVWGVDVAGIMAGVGVLTLIIGLGCQSLIQDVVSGLFIVFDDYFAQGDMVIIDGFRGTVVEVGLKTTKLEDFGGNIKSITNSSITTVVNMSRLRSVCTIKLSVSYNEDVERVESLIIKECEKLPTKIPNITEGPWYKGIDAISASSVDFLVLAFCSEDDRFQVTRDLNREFYLLFKRHNIQIPFNQVTVNPADEKERKKASEEQIETAKKAQNLLRGIEGKTPKKKRTVASTVRESLDKTRKDMEDY